MNKLNIKLIMNILFIGVFLTTFSILFYKFGVTSVKQEPPIPIEIKQDKFDCPRKVSGGIYKEFVGPMNEFEVVDEPKLIESPELVKTSEPFIESEYEKGLNQYLSTKAWSSRKFDVTSDGKDETIINANITMNHTPNLATVVENGKIIFQRGGASVWIDEVYGGQGFLYKENEDWITGEDKLTRYIYKDGGFLPVWTQKVCWVKFE